MYALVQANSAGDVAAVVFCVCSPVHAMVLFKALLLRVFPANVAVGTHPMSYIEAKRC